MRRVFNFVVVAIVASGALVIGQGADVAKVLASVREALGGEKKLTEVRTLTANGRVTRVSGQTSAPPTDFELAFELPGKFVKKDTLAVIGGETISRTSGFNGGTVIEVVDVPPQMPGRVMIRPTSGGVSLPPGTPPTPEQEAAMKKASLASARQEFARLTLGMFATSYESYPIAFKYIGQAESPDGTADVLEATAGDGFVAKLFVDARTHLPLMLTWMAKEPLAITRSAGDGPSGAPMVMGGHGAIHAVGGQVRMSGTPEEIEKMQQEMDERRKEAEAKRRVVEHRLYYSDYRDVNGVKLPFSLQRAIDGQPVEEVRFEHVKINPKIDPKKFEGK